MTPTRAALFIVLSAALVAAGGCKRMTSACNKPQLYAEAQDLPPLKVPVGLDGPDTRAALKIPPLNEPEAPRRKGDPCLEDPPALTNPAPPKQ